MIRRLARSAVSAVESSLRGGNLASRLRRADSCNTLLRDWGSLSQDVCAILPEFVCQLCWRVSVKRSHPCLDITVTCTKHRLDFRWCQSQQNTCGTHGVAIAGTFARGRKAPGKFRAKRILRPDFCHCHSKIGDRVGQVSKIPTQTANLAPEIGMQVQERSQEWDRCEFGQSRCEVAQVFHATERRYHSTLIQVDCVKPLVSCQTCDGFSELATAPMPRPPPRPRFLSPPIEPSARTSRTAPQ